MSISEWYGFGRINLSFLERYGQGQRAATREAFVAAVVLRGNGRVKVPNVLYGRLLQVETVEMIQGRNRQVAVNYKLLRGGIDGGIPCCDRGCGLRLGKSVAWLEAYASSQ